MLLPYIPNIHNNGNANIKYFPLSYGDCHLMLKKTVYTDFIHRHCTAIYHWSEEEVIIGRFTWLFVIMAPSYCPFCCCRC